MLKRIAIIRKETVRGCPFGLPIVTACLNAGDSVERMADLIPQEEERWPQMKKANRRIYRHYKDGERCPYADKIAKKNNAVHCDLGESGEKMRDFPMRPSPYYPRVFSGMGSSNMFSWPVDYYADNPDARSIFSGVYSVYASTGEINIQKHSFIPDPILTELVENIAIKQE
jgi:hypothetical protein